MESGAGAPRRLYGDVLLRLFSEENAFSEEEVLSGAAESGKLEFDEGV